MRELVAAEEQQQAWALGMSCLLLDAKALVGQARATGRDGLADPVWPSCAPATAR